MVFSHSLTFFDRSLPFFFLPSSSSSSSSSSSLFLKNIQRCLDVWKEKTLG